MNPTATKKRKNDSDDDNGAKRVKLTSQTTATVDPRPKPGTSAAAKPTARANEPAGQGKPAATAATEPKKRPKINKLAPKRPYPTVPTSVSATGPRSAHKEGKNCICLTRKTKLSAYMRRCKDVIMKDGYKTLHLSALGAAIPLLLQLAAALPPILPFSKDEIKLDIQTGTVECQDEVMPEDEDEDISYQTRNKSALNITLTIGDGEFEGGKSGGKSAKRKPGAGRFTGTGAGNGKGKEKAASGSSSGQVVLQEPEQDDMEML